MSAAANTLAVGIEQDDLDAGHVVAAQLQSLGFGEPDEIRLHLLAKISDSGRHLQRCAGIGTRGRKAKTGGQLMWLEACMWRQPPIWEPQGTNFRPYSITTLIFFYIGKFFGLLFRRRR